MVTRARRFRRPILIGAIFLLVAGSAYQTILMEIGTFLIVDDHALQRADLIHVLGGGKDRVDYGIDLVQEGYGSQILFTGAEPTINADYAREYALSLGVDAASIVNFPSAGASTYEEAVELAQYLAGTDPNLSVIVVSNPYHMRRVRWVFGRVLDARARVQYAAVPFDVASHKIRWWSHGPSRSMVVREYAKIVFYWLNYGVIAARPLPTPHRIETSNAIH